jgi:hypothetical protein
LKDALDIEATLMPGKPGQFDVEANGRLVFSKHKESRFPEHFEILESLKG